MSIAQWIMFQQVFGYGTTRAQKILDVYESAENIFENSVTDLQKTGILTAKELDKLLKKDALNDFAEKQIELAYQRNAKIVTLSDPEYPERLRNIYSPPAVLFINGDISGIDETPAIGVVGTRRYTDYGKNVTAEFAQQMVKHNIITISGLALGIDTVAHLETLKVGGRTIAVIGNGLDITYPLANEHLYRMIVENGGAVITEFPFGTQPLPYHFPIRNRIISGLALGILVVEGTRHSGTLITAGHAIAQNREVFAVPGNICSPMSDAPNWLIKQGAILTTSIHEILEAYPYYDFKKENKKYTQVALETFENKDSKTLAPKPLDVNRQSNRMKAEIPAYLNDNQRLVLDCIGTVPSSADEIAERTQMPVHQILSALTQLEIFGLIIATAGRKFQLKL